MKCQHCNGNNLQEELEGREVVMYCNDCQAPLASRYIVITSKQAVEMRQALGVSQSELADYISKHIFKGRHVIDRRTISAMENGRNDVAWYVSEALDLIKAGKR